MEWPDARGEWDVEEEDEKEKWRVEATRKGRRKKRASRTFLPSFPSALLEIMKKESVCKGEKVFNFRLSLRFEETRKFFSHCVTWSTQ